MLKIALCQTKVFMNKEMSLSNVAKILNTAADNGAQLCILPEMFNCPYGNNYFRDFSESETTSITLEMIKRICIQRCIYIVAGSVPEREGDKLYNTSYTVSPEGYIIAKHRKIHMFDVNIKNGTCFMESDTITPGDSISVFDTSYGRMGVCICYDLRFPELFRKMVINGAKVIFVPAAFSSVTGPKHWELLLRARAIDCQCYVAGISPSVDSEGGFKPYGNSMMIDPWGDIVARTYDNQSIVYGEINFDYIDSVRQQLPILKHIRQDIYY